MQQTSKKVTVPLGPLTENMSQIRKALSAQCVQNTGKTFLCYLLPPETPHHKAARKVHLALRKKQ